MLTELWSKKPGLDAQHFQQQRERYVLSRDSHEINMA